MPLPAGTDAYLGGGFILPKDPAPGVCDAADPVLGPCTIEHTAWPKRHGTTWPGFTAYWR